MLQIKSCYNHAGLFAKSLSLAILEFVKGIGTRRFKDLQGSGGEPL
jgi:hypothetical protein